MWERTWVRYGWLAGLWARAGWGFGARWRAHPRAPVRTFRVDYHGLVAGAGGDVLVFVPVGRFVEFYGAQRLLAERVLGLRRAYLPRAGFAFTTGFPVWRWNAYARRALAAGVAVAVVGRSRGGVRAPLRIVCPAGDGGDDIRACLAFAGAREALSVARPLTPRL